MDYAEMERRLNTMRAQGIREFIIFVLYGLEFPFVGNEWLTGRSGAQTGLRFV